MTPAVQELLACMDAQPARTRIRTSLREDTLVVHGDLRLSTTDGIVRLPEGLVVEGDLHLLDTRIPCLPHKLSVGKELYIRNSPITCLPSSLSVGSDIWLENTEVTFLPSPLRVHGHLTLSNCPIATLPDGLDVLLCLDIERTPITRFPLDMRVGGGITPPSCLHDLVVFMQGQPDQVSLRLQGHTMHEVLQLRENFQAFPDLLRVLDALFSRCALGVIRQRDGGLVISIDWQDI